jgi:hypothetical protein
MAGGSKAQAHPSAASRACCLWPWAHSVAFRLCNYILSHTHNALFIEQTTLYLPIAHTSNYRKSRNLLL